MKKGILLLTLILGGTLLWAQERSDLIVVDQFGYLPDSRKVAVLRNPELGFDADLSYVPPEYMYLVDARSGEKLLRARPVAWMNGALDESSGDRCWHFDFSQVSATGEYYVYDEEHHLRSSRFRIAPNVYNHVLKEAMRSFFYQRVGMEKKLPYAEVAWEDEASHSGDLQDNNARSWYDKNNPDGERDVSGGWYDAGDYNKYTSWTANYVTSFMLAYLEAPQAWGDDYNIPESGDGMPDILNEAIYGLDHLLRMQQDDGSVLSIVGEAGASPPSAATEPSYYGPPNTSATRNCAAAFALASVVYRDQGLPDYADTLLQRSLKAWGWAELHPDSLFRNNDAAWGSQGLGAGQQEVSDYGREMIRLEAACYLFEATGETRFQDAFDSNYRNTHMFQWNGYVYPYESTEQDLLLYYTTLDGATPAVKEDILDTYRGGTVNGSDNLKAYQNGVDPYFAHLDSYTWGSNGIKGSQGSIHYNLLTYGMAEGVEAEALHGAEAFIHYIHGVNPLGMVYLSNMYAHGAEKSVNEFYHSWFTNGSPLWDRVGESTYGPAPGFLTGGANPSYDWDGCCPSGCGSSGNNAKCKSESIAPPKGQPKQKSYKDFNTSWPLNSWSVTENSCGYQTRYIRLLSKFVQAGMDCNGEVDGGAFVDSCGSCAGGSTGIEPVLDPALCQDDIPDGDTMYVEGRHLYTSAGERVVLRGVNEMFAWGSDLLGERLLPEIDQTGANCVRLVWTEEVGQKDKLVRLIENTIARKMIAMPECHSATGEWDKLDVCIHFWKDPVLLEGIQANRKWTLVNIGNEVGDGMVTAQQFKEGYMRAIDSLRGWGYTVPLVIDASTWGQNLEVILATWEEILAHDPLQNILFSVHSYWSDTDHYERVVNASINDGLPIIIGEGPSPTSYPNCGVLDYAHGLEALGNNDVGWLFWSWGGIPNGHCVPNFDLTDGDFGSWLTPHARDMAVDHPYSLLRSARRPASFYEGGEVLAAGIYLNLEALELPVGDSLPLEVLVMPVNAAGASWTLALSGGGMGGEVQYNSESGYLKGLKEGPVQIDVALDSQAAIRFSSQVEVLYVPVSSIAFDPEQAWLEVGEHLEFSVSVWPENATEPAYHLVLEGEEGVVLLDEEAGTVTALEQGSARLEALWDHGEVKGSLELMVSNPVSLEEDGLPGMRVYPNPVEGKLHVEFEHPGAVLLSILDLDGRILLEQRHAHHSELDLSALAAGNYVLRIMLEDRTYYRKLSVR